MRNQFGFSLLLVVHQLMRPTPAREFDENYPKLLYQKHGLMYACVPNNKKKVWSYDCSLPNIFLHNTGHKVLEIGRRKRRLVVVF